MRLLNKHIKLCIYYLIILSSLLSLSGCSLEQHSIEAYSQNGVFFDTLISITVYDSSESHAKSILDECINLCTRYEELFDERNPKSELYRLNNSDGKPCKVSAETTELLEKGYDFSASSDGKFDITIYSVSHLWDFHDDSGKIPTNEEISSAVSHVNYKNLVIDTTDNTVCLTDPESSIDAGAVAKGYIGDKLADYLIASNITGAIINIGGDIKTIGSKPLNKNFTIGIADPFNDSNTLMALSVPGNKAVATSGTYERVINDGQNTYHHILDPATGYPVSTDLVSSTIICDSASDADTLCTIAILYGSVKAIDFIETLPNTEAVLIKDDGSVLTTSNASSYIIKQ